MNDVRQQFLLDVPEPALDHLRATAIYESKARTAADDHVMAAWWMQFAASVLSVQALRVDKQLKLVDDDAVPF